MQTNKQRFLALNGPKFIKKCLDGLPSETLSHYPPVRVTLASAKMLGVFETYMQQIGQIEGIEDAPYEEVEAVLEQSFRGHLLNALTAGA